MLLTDKYTDKIYGTITCYDRIIIQGYIPGWSYADGMANYLKAHDIRIFDFSQTLTEQVRQNAQRIAGENGIEIEFIRKLRAFRKDGRIQTVIPETGKTEGLIHIFSAMDRCNTYRPWHDKTTGKTFLKQGLHKVLDILAKRSCPAADSLGFGYTWTAQQIECATDIMFKQQTDLEPLYDDMIRTAIHTIKPDNIATFLGQRITYNCKKEVGTNYNQRIPGTGIKHHMGDVSIKMYDKSGCVLRIEHL